MKVEIEGASKERVALLTEMFEKGFINILIGTKSLLGEGWDSPCINSLILASFVGSFMLSNQMRGRAIRVDRNNSHKVSNIWHLVTVLPESVSDKMISPKKAIKSLANCVLKTLTETGIIQKGGYVTVASDMSNTYIYCTLENASVREKQLFSQAIGEMFSAIDNPRYVFVKKGLDGRKSYSKSYSCLGILAGNKETAELLGRNIEKIMGKYYLICTGTEQGRKELLNCRRYSFLNINDALLQNKKMVKSNWR